jgi:alpha-beta hydrolase superfamily lysophospholipase
MMKKPLTTVLVASTLLSNIAHAQIHPVDEFFRNNAGGDVLCATLRKTSAGEGLYVIGNGLFKFATNDEGVIYGLEPLSEAPDDWSCAMTFPDCMTSCEVDYSNFNPPMDWPLSTKILMPPSGVLAIGIYANPKTSNIEFFVRNKDKSFEDKFSVPGNHFWEDNNAKYAAVSVFDKRPEEELRQLYSPTDRVVIVNLEEGRVERTFPIRAKGMLKGVNNEYIAFKDCNSWEFFYVDDQNQVRTVGPSSLAEGDVISDSVPDDLEVFEVIGNNDIFALNMRNLSSSRIVHQFYQGVGYKIPFEQPLSGKASFLGTFLAAGKEEDGRPADVNHAAFHVDSSHGDFLKVFALNTPSLTTLGERKSLKGIKAYSATIPISPAFNVVEPYFFTVPSSQGHSVPVHYWRADNPRGLILDLHGGPHAYLGPELDWNVQALLSQGYSYAQPEPRGSVGYGQEYAKALDGKWGDVDVKDVMTVYEYFKALYGDMCIFIQGHSYGGYLSALVMTKFPNSFCGAVLNAGPYDVSLMEQECLELYPSECMDQDGSLNHNGEDFKRINECHRQKSKSFDCLTLWHDQWGFSPQEDPARSVAISPAYHVENLSAPVLLVTGEEDYVVSVSHFQGLFNAAKMAGRNITGVVFSGEGHSILNPTPTKLLTKLMIEFYNAILDGRYKAPSLNEPYFIVPAYEPQQIVHSFATPDPSNTEPLMEVAVGTNSDGVEVNQ